MDSDLLGSSFRVYGLPRYPLSHFECTRKAAQAPLSVIDPIYVDAMELARFLIDHGFTVRCVQASEMHNVFDGQTGAALYVTDKGSLTFFLPKEQNFTGVQVVELNEGAQLVVVPGNSALTVSYGLPKPMYNV